MVHKLHRPESEVPVQVIDAAYAMFASRGIRNVSMAEVEAAAGLSPDAVGEWFTSRDDVGAAFLQRRELEWFYGAIEAGVQQYDVDADDRLLAIFDVFGEWFQRDDYEACRFITVMLAQDTGSPVGLARIGHLSRIRDIIGDFARAAALTDVENFCLSWHILMKGAVSAAVEGDPLAPLRAKVMARALIESHRPPARFEQSGDEDLSWLEWDL